MARVLRFNISPEMTEKLREFHEKTKHLGKIEYKKQWSSFIEVNNHDVAQEERTLLNCGFTGNVEKKLFTSVKYYIGKKSEEKADPKERRTYIHIDKNIIEVMNDHIISNKDTDNYTPAIGYSAFCEQYEQELIIEKNRLKTVSELTDKEIEFKIKKTYKNRYFILCK